MTSKILLFLTSLEPFPASMLLVALPTIGIAMLAWSVRRTFGYEKLVVNNQLAGIKYGIVALAYVMLLTFATITVWDKFSLAQTSVIEEASAARAIASILNKTSKDEQVVLHALGSYLESVITIGWPEMAKENEAPETTLALVHLYKSARILDRASSEGSQTAIEVFKHIDRINDAREIRITLSKGIVPSLLWYVLIAGATLTIAFSLFFGGESFLAQMMMTSMTSAVLLMALLIIVAFDHPFTGAVSIGSEPLQMALQDVR